MKMPKKDKLDKEEIKRVIEELKSNADENALKEIKELEQAIESLFVEVPLYKRILTFLLTFAIHFVILYIISLVCFGFFMDLIVVNKHLIFLIATFIGVILTLFEVIPRNPYRKHFIVFNLLLFISIIAIACTVNYGLMPIFKFSSIWIIYLVFVEMIYTLFEYSLTRKFQGL